MSLHVLEERTGIAFLWIDVLRELEFMIRKIKAKSNAKSIYQHEGQSGYQNDHLFHPKQLIDLENHFF